MEFLDFFELNIEKRLPIFERKTKEIKRITPDQMKFHLRLSKYSRFLINTQSYPPSRDSVFRMSQAFRGTLTIDTAHWDV